MTAPRSLPSFFVIGAAKCGTTSLHNYLGDHPGISMSSTKEPELFASDEGLARLGEYEAMLEGAADARGESSVVYTQRPRWIGAAGRIARHVPGARFIYMVRDPVDRAVAHWSTVVAAGKEKRSLSESLADYDNEWNPYVAPSRYAWQLEPFLETFGGERILVADAAELREDPVALLQRIFEFLGVDGSYTPTAVGTEHNVASQQRTETALGRRVGSGRLRELAAAAPVPATLRQRLRDLVSRPVARPELEAGLRAGIADHLEPDMVRLEQLTGCRPIRARVISRS